MLIRRIRLAAVGISAGCLLLAAHQLQAQWGTNAPPCSGPCVPVRDSWGYYKTCWRRWPCDIYAGTTQRPGGMTEGVPPGTMELPTPSREAEIRVPSPSRQPANRLPAGGGNEPTLAPIPGDRALEPAPRGDGAMPGAGPGGRSDINELPVTLPPDELPAGPMGSNRAPRGSAPRNSESLPRLKLRNTGADNVARRGTPAVPGTRLVANHREAVPPSSAARSSRVIPVSRQPAIMPSEPELFAPSPTSMPLNALRTDDEAKSTSDNPLRSGVVQAAAFEEEGPAPIDEGGPSPGSGAVSANPLRR
jgi:hypothetical protein